MGLAAGFVCVFGISRRVQRPDRERVKWGLHFVSCDSPRVWLLRPLEAERVLQPDPGVLGTSGTLGGLCP